MKLSRRSFLSAHAAVLGASFLPGGLLAAAEGNTPAMPKLDDWDAVRAQFRLRPDLLHFAGFFIASHPQPVRAAIEGFRQALDENPFYTVEHGMFGAETDALERKVCEDAAAYLGGAADEIALTGSTTASLSLVYHGLPLKAGDEVLTTRHDHFVHHEAIRLACERNGAMPRRIALFDKAATASVDGIVERIREAIRPNTRVLGLTWVHSSTGMRLPIRQIADALAELNREREPDQRVLLVLDGVHGIGAVDAQIAELGCDFFCAGTHKWLFAPRGTGIVWAKTENWARLRPLIPSFSSVELYNAWGEERPVRGPTRADHITPGGFHAYEHHWAIGAAFRLHTQIGRARIGERIHALNDQMRQGLVKLPKLTLHTPLAPELSAGICCFEIDGHTPAQIVAALLERKIIASTTPYAVTYARLAAGLMNTPEEVDTVLAAVRTLTRG